MIALIGVIITVGSLFIAGLALYYSWYQKQEKILVKLTEEKKEIYVNEVSLDPSNNFNVRIVSIGRKYIFSLTNVTSEPIFITKIFYKDPKTHSIDDSNLCTSNSPLELVSRHGANNSRSTIVTT